MSLAPKILVINLTRLGDILQSTALLRALKDRHPESEIHFLAVNRFAEVCRHIPEIDQVIPFNFGSAIAASKEAMNHLTRRLGEVAQFVQSLRQYRYDTVINLSHSRISALLCHLLNVEDTRGLILDREGFRQIRHPWANYFFTANLNRTFNRFNLVDVNLGLAWREHDNGDAGRAGRKSDGKLSFKIPEEALRMARELLPVANGEPARPLIGFQPGASLPNKRWPSAAFIELGRRLKEALSAQIVIFGSANETDLAAEIAQALGDDAVNLAGRTDIPVLAAALQRLDLLISNDTGTQHLAAAVGTPVLSLCFGSALSHETGPYGRGHLVVEPTISCFPCSFHVECPRFRCHEQVLPEAVRRLAQEMLKTPGKEMESVPDEALFRDITVWRTDFDRDGFWIQRPLFKRTLIASDLINLVGREVWKAILTPSQGRQNLEEIGSWILDLIHQDHLRVKGPDMEIKIGRCVAALKRLQSCARQGTEYARQLKRKAPSPTADLDEIRRLGDLLLQEDRTINQVGASHPEVNSICLDFVWGKQNLQGHRLAHLAADTERLYGRLFHLSELHLSAIQFVMNGLESVPSAGIKHEETCLAGA